MAQVPADLKVCIFDVFGTVVDWRGSLIEDLPKLGKKYGMDTDWTSFADDWRGLYQPQMGRVRKGELPWTRIDDLHKEAFEMLLDDVVEVALDVPALGHPGGRDPCPGGTHLFELEPKLLHGGQVVHRGTTPSGSL